MSEKLICPNVEPCYIEKIILPSYQIKDDIEKILWQLNIDNIELLVDRDMFSEIYYNFY